MLKGLHLVIGGDSRGLSNALSESERRVKGFGRRTIRTFRRIGSTINSVGDRYLTGFNSLLGGAAITLAGKQVIDLDARLARLAIQSGKTGGELAGLKDKLFEVAKATNQDVNALVDYIDAIVERTGDFDGAMKTLKAGAIVASATGTDLGAIGATVSNLMDKAGVSSENVLGVLDILNVQAKAGAVSLAKFAPLMERLVAASGRFNVKGEEGIRVLGAWVQLAKKGSGSAEQATTAIEGSIAEMLDPKKFRKMRAFGFDPVAMKKDGVTYMKELDVVLKGIIEATKGDETKLGQIFGRESIRGITRLAQVYRETGGFGEFDKFIKQGGDGAETMKDFAFWTEQTAATLKDFRTGLSEFANENLALPIELLNDSLSFLNKHPALSNAGLWSLLGMGGVMLGGKLLRGWQGMFSKGAGATGSLGGLGGLSGPTPVYVVNKHLSMLPGKGGWFPGGAAGKAAGKAGAAGRVGKFLGMGALGAATTVGAIGVALGKGSTMLLDALGKIPFVAEYENKRAEFLSTHKWDQEKQKYVELKNQINLQVHIDKEGRVYSESDDMNTKVDTGAFIR